MFSEFRSAKEQKTSLFFSQVTKSLLQSYTTRSLYPSIHLSLFFFIESRSSPSLSRPPIKILHWRIRFIEIIPLFFSFPPLLLFSSFIRRYKNSNVRTFHRVSWNLTLFLCRIEKVRINCLFTSGSLFVVKSRPIGISNPRGTLQIGNFVFRNEIKFFKTCLSNVFARSICRTVSSTRDISYNCVSPTDQERVLSTHNWCCKPYRTYSTHAMK